VPGSTDDRSASPPRADSPAEDRPFASVRRSSTTAPEPPSPPGDPSAAPPTLLSDKFVERGPLGRGGSSTVVRALDKDLLRDVAVKVLLSDQADAAGESARFAEEARVTGQLEHPNIIPVYEFGTQQNGRRYLCMRLVEGETLEAVLARVGEARLEPDALADFLQVFVKICDAVAFAHSRGVIHRDLKPMNIMISDFGQVYLLDWGIARILPGLGQGPRVRLSEGAEGGEGEVERVDRDLPGQLIGTLCYMAPEQLQGRHDALDQRTDVFALGGTLYQILTGQPPLTTEAIRAIWMRHTPPPIARPEELLPGGRVPPELARIAMKATAYEPADRYASVAELKRDIESFQRGAWHLPRVSLPAGTIVVQEGDSGDAAYVIVEGQCAAYRVEGAAEIELRVMGPGEVFGETAVFSDKPRTASVRALTDVVLLTVTSAVLSQAVGLNSWMGAFVKALAERFREADERLRGMPTSSSRGDF
jgi:tRNA A-37 threonylcarbamoyl transferase component Bud32